MQALTQRIQAALRETPEMRSRSKFSEYAPRVAASLRARLDQAAESGGIGGVEAALDEFDRMDATEDPLALRHALQLFITHNRHALALGLEVPPLAERAPWMTIPSRRERD
jgi:hypothetical protein